MNSMPPESSLNQENLKTQSQITNEDLYNSNSEKLQHTQNCQTDYHPLEELPIGPTGFNDHGASEQQKPTLTFNPQHEELVTKPFGETVMPEYQNDLQNHYEGHPQPNHESHKHDSTFYSSDLNPLLKHNMIHQSVETRAEPGVSQVSEGPISQHSEGTDPCVHTFEPAPAPAPDTNSLTTNQSNPHATELPTEDRLPNELLFRNAENRTDRLNEDLRNNINIASPVKEPNPVNLEITNNSIEDILLPNERQKNYSPPTQTDQIPVAKEISPDFDQANYLVEGQSNTPSLPQFETPGNFPDPEVSVGNHLISNTNLPSANGLSNLDLGPGKQHQTHLTSQFAPDIVSDTHSAIQSNTPVDAPLFPDGGTLPVQPVNTSKSDVTLAPIKEPSPVNNELTTSSIENTLIPSTHQTNLIPVPIEGQTSDNALNSKHGLLREQGPLESSLTSGNDLKPSHRILPTQTNALELEQHNKLPSESLLLENQHSTDDTGISKPFHAEDISATGTPEPVIETSNNLVYEPGPLGRSEAKELEMAEEIVDVVPPVVNPLFNANDSELTMNPLIALATATKVDPIISTTDIPQAETDQETPEIVPEVLTTPQLMLTPRQEQYQNPLDQIDTQRDPLVQCNEEIPLPTTQLKFARIPEQHQFVPGAYPDADYPQFYESGVETVPMVEKGTINNKLIIIGGEEAPEPVIVHSVEVPIPDEAQYLPGAFPSTDQQYNPYEETLEEMLNDVRDHLSDNEQKNDHSVRKNEPQGAVSEFSNTFTVGPTEKKQLRKQENNQYTPQTNVKENQQLINTMLSTNASSDQSNQPGLSNDSSSSLSESSGPNTHPHGEHEIPHPEEGSSFIAIGDIVTGKIQSGLGTITRSRRLKQRGKILEDEGKQVLEAKKRNSISSG